MSKKSIDYYMNIDWTLVHGEDLDFNQNIYSYIEIRELPSFAICAKTKEKCLEIYKHKLKLFLTVALENNDKIIEPNEWTEEEVIDPWA